jgi:tRNA-dihydrouridine synthase B
VVIAKIAESCGVQALTVHGRTRACGFSGRAEYLTIKRVKAAVSIPVIANGDIDSPEKARQVLEETQADALMIGRAALGQPWLFSLITAYLDGGPAPDAPGAAQRKSLLLSHLQEVHAFYGGLPGVRIARKHIGWYAEHWPGLAPESLKPIYAEENPDRQIRLTRQLFDPDLWKLAA